MKRRSRKPLSLTNGISSSMTISRGIRGFSGYSKKMDASSYRPVEPVSLPVEVVFHPSWWHKHGRIDFDEDFFWDPRRRVEDERRMERVLYERFGDLGLGEDRDLC